MAKKVNLKAVTAAAAKAVVADQSVSYQLIADKFKIGMGTVTKVLKRLEVQGLIRRGSDRKWVVLVDKDGKRKPDNEVPPKRIFRKKRRRKVDAVKKTTSAAMPRKAIANGEIADAEKLELLENLTRAVKGRKSLVLTAIQDDVQKLIDNRDLLSVMAE